MRGTEKLRQFSGTGNIENQNFNLGEQVNNRLYNRGIGTPCAAIQGDIAGPLALVDADSNEANSLKNQCKY